MAGLAAPAAAGQEQSQSDQGEARREAKAGGDLTAEVWFAPSLQYLPVRIKVSMGDETHVDLIVDQIEQK